MLTARLGRLQLRIMQVLWDRGRATAREVTDALSAAGVDPAVAHSTVQTLLRQLEDKAVVGHDADGRTFSFRPLIDAPSVTRGATRDLIDRVFGGSAAGLVAHLLKEERIAPAELRAIRQLIEDRAGKPKG